MAAVASNPIYHMVQEAVESYDLGVHIRNLAKTATLCMQAIPGETPAEMLDRQDIADEYQRAAFDLRDRALARLDILIADPTFINAAGAAQAARLEIIRDRFAADPFEGLDADDGMELPYSKLHNDVKKEFWLSRCDENVVAWYWQFRGVMDIRETVAHEPFRTYSQDEFAHTCDSMWMHIICNNVHRTEWVQQGNVKRRKLDASVVTAEDQSEYRKACRVFNMDWNADNGGTVSSMSVIRVLLGGFDEKNGYEREVTQWYARAVRHKYLAAESVDEDY
jgi:hypothetical protein